MGQVFLSAGIEGWGDRHGRTPGDPQTWRETKNWERKKDFRLGLFYKRCLKCVYVSAFLSSTYSD